MDQALVVFLDRDGVICRYYPNDYAKSWAEFEFLPGAKEALRLLKQAGAQVFVISNQGGINKGLFTLESLTDIDARMNRAVEAAGGKITAAYYCPHTAEENCPCRKPKTGLVEKAVSEFGLDLRNSRGYFVGDTASDIITGRQSRLTTVLVLSGKTKLISETQDWPVKPDHIAPDLSGALKYIL